MRAAKARLPNGVYVTEHRGGHAVELVAIPPAALGRHATDDLYGIAPAAGLDADVTLLTGPQPAQIVDADIYRRLAADVRGNGGRVIADLSGASLQAALQGTVNLLRVSAGELVDAGFADGDDPVALARGAMQAREAGADCVVVSQPSGAALLAADGDVTELAPLHFEAVESRGTGDSMFAALGVGLARGMSDVDALRRGLAAGALNASRLGLGTGTRTEIERLAAHVMVRPRHATRER